MDGDDAPTTSISADAFRAGHNFCLMQEQFVISKKVLESKSYVFDYEHPDCRALILNVSDKKSAQHYYMRIFLTIMLHSSVVYCMLRCGYNTTDNSLLRIERVTWHWTCDSWHWTRRVNNVLEAEQRRYFVKDIINSNKYFYLSWW